MVKQIKSYIAKGKTKEAIDILQSFEATHPNLEREILSIRSRYNILASNMVKGILDNNEINIERAKIHNSIFVICELVEKSKKHETKKKTLSPKKIKYSLFAIPCLVLGVILFHSFIKNYQDDTTINSEDNEYYSSTFSNPTEYIDNEETLGFSASVSNNNQDSVSIAINSDGLPDILPDIFLDSLNFGFFSGNTKNNEYFTDVNGDNLIDIFDSNSIQYQDLPTNSSTLNHTFDAKLNAKESLNTGISFRKIEEYRIAQLHLTKAIRDSIGFVAAYLNRGIVNRKTKNYESAIEDYNKALKYSPNNPAILISRSVVYLRINELDRAMEGCNLAIQINPNLAEAYNSKGNILFVQRLYKEAIVEYNRALELKHLYSYSLIGRGMAKYKLHEDSSDVYCADILKAIKLNRSLNLSPFNEICK